MKSTSRAWDRGARRAIGRAKERAGVFVLADFFSLNIFNIYSPVSGWIPACIQNITPPPKKSKKQTNKQT